MDNEQERRATGMRRVPVQALVEICGRDAGGAPAFEAESVDVSGRGMHLRTAYLPEIGSPLVCRFENGGREIVVEGVVAWSAEEERGGEFGIQFTALDSGSVESLKVLCGMNDEAEADAAPQNQTPSSGAEVGTGSRVRLHIDGLGSPMKACIRTNAGKQLQVASNLEFLKVGRHLEVEDVSMGDRRGAQIDGVDVVIDPQTRVPQLVVALRYDRSETTPEPSVIDSEPMAHAAAPAAAMAMSASVASTDDEDDALGEDDFVPAEDEVMDEAQAMRGKLANAAVGAGEAAKKGGAIFASYGAKAASGLGTLFKGAGAKMLELRHKKSRGDAPRRTTAAPPTGVMSGAGRRLRPQSAAAAEPDATEAAPMDPTAKKRRVKKIAALSALGVLLLTVGVLAMKKPSAPPGADAAKEPAAVAVAANPATDVTKVDEQGNPIGDKALPPPPPAGSGAGTNADVPLFGPTPMATMEPAPLGPAPSAGAADGDKADDADEGKDEEAQEKAAASAAVDDQGFGDDGDAKKGEGGPWGNGKVNDPVVYRLKLDKAGTSIQGAVNATGFTVKLPGVKVMDSTKAITERDSRIARVKTQNSSTGAEIGFQFKDGIPGYRVRLKKDYVEFLISSAAKGGDADKTVASTGGKHKKKHKKAGMKKPPAAKAQAKGGAKKKHNKKKAG